MERLQADVNALAIRIIIIKYFVIITSLGHIAYVLLPVKQNRNQFQALRKLLHSLQVSCTQYLLIATIALHQVRAWGKASLRDTILIPMLSTWVMNLRSASSFSRL